MLQEMPVMSSGGGGGNVVEDTIASPSSSVDLGFQPKRLFLYFYNKNGYYQICYYDGEYDNGYQINSYGGGGYNRVALPNTTYAGLKNLTSNGFELTYNANISNMHYIAEKP